MDIIVIHSLVGRVRCRDLSKQLAFYQHNVIAQALSEIPGVASVEVNPRTGSLLFHYDVNVIGENALISLIKEIKLSSFPIVKNQEDNRSIGWSFVGFLLFKIILPTQIKPFFTLFSASKYVSKGVRSLRKKRMGVDLLDGVAVSFLIGQRNFRSASLLMTLLKTGDYLEEWAKKRSEESLASTLSLNIGQVWIRKDGQEEQIPYSLLKIGDHVIVRAGAVVPVDGIVIKGEALVNESSMTGEPLSVMRSITHSVYAGTALEEGELLVEVRNKGDDTRFQKVIQLIQDSENYKADIETKANAFADSVVPFNLGVSALTYLVTRNPNKTAATLSVDYSCAIKLSTPLVFLAAMKEALQNGAFIKGGVALEKLSQVDTIVFDKTGTLTKATPKIVKIVPYHGYSEQEVLKIAACLEEHFPHPIANAVVDHAADMGVDHKEAHTEVKYIVAHGIATSYEGEHTIIGSRHFIHDDEGVDVSVAFEEEALSQTEGYSLLYLAREGKLAGVLFIQDPVREEAAEVIQMLHALGIKRILMLTGDNSNTAKRVAEQLGIDTYRGDMKPDDKAAIVKTLTEKGCKVAVVGDGMNDSPAMSMAHLGIAMKDGADIAMAVADITLKEPSLYPLVIARLISQKAMQKVNRNNQAAVGINSVLMMLGMFGIIPETAAVWLHNLTTLGISVNSMRNMLPQPSQSEEY